MLETHTLSTPQNFQVKHSIAPFRASVEKILDTSKVWIENTTWVGYILERGSRRRGYHVCSFTCLVSHKVVTTFWCCKSSYPISFSYSSFMLITKVSSHDTRIILSISFRYTYNYKSHASTHQKKGLAIAFLHVQCICIFRQPKTSTQNLSNRLNMHVILDHML